MADGGGAHFAKKRINFLKTPLSGILCSGKWGSAATITTIRPNSLILGDCLATSHYGREGVPNKENNFTLLLFS